MVFFFLLQFMTLVFKSKVDRNTLIVDISLSEALGQLPHRLK